MKYLIASILSLGARGLVSADCATFSNGQLCLTAGYNNNGSYTVTPTITVNDGSTPSVDCEVQTPDGVVTDLPSCQGMFYYGAASSSFQYRILRNRESQTLNQYPTTYGTTNPVYDPNNAYYNNYNYTNYNYSTSYDPYNYSYNTNYVPSTTYVAPTYTPTYTNYNYTTPTYSNGNSYAIQGFTIAQLAVANALLTKWPTLVSNLRNADVKLRTSSRREAVETAVYQNLQDVIANTQNRAYKTYDQMIAAVKNFAYVTLQEK